MQQKIERLEIVLLIQTKAAGEESDGGEQQDVFSPLRPDAISGCVTAGGCSAQVAQMPQTHTHTRLINHKLFPTQRFQNTPDTCTYCVPIEKKNLNNEIC